MTAPTMVVAVYCRMRDLGFDLGLGRRRRVDAEVWARHRSSNNQGREDDNRDGGQQSVRRQWVRQTAVRERVRVIGAQGPGWVRRHRTCSS